MSSLKVKGSKNKIERAVLNTTISKEIFDEFKISCKDIGVPMNVIIETFMRQFNDGGFFLKFEKEKRKIEIDISSDEQG